MEKASQVKTIYERLVQTVKEADVELFLFESPHNHYQPVPPEGYFGIRSHKRRLFVQLDEGRIPVGKIQDRINSGEYIEYQLT